MISEVKHRSYLLGHIIPISHLEKKCISVPIGSNLGSPRLIPEVDLIVPKFSLTMPACTLKCGFLVPPVRGRMNLHPIDVGFKSFHLLLAEGVGAEMMVSWFWTWPGGVLHVSACLMALLPLIM